MLLVVGVNEIYCEVRCQCLHLVSGHRTLLTSDTRHVYLTPPVRTQQIMTRARISVTIGPIGG